MQTGKFTKEIIEAAIGGFLVQKQHIDEQIAELRAMLEGAPAAPAAAAPAAGGRRKLSAAAIERIREGQKRRWAAAKRSTSAAPAKAAKTPKRRLSAAGRKAIVDALKRRWAAKKAATKAS